MTEGDAHTLAAVVRTSTAKAASVEPAGDDFIVVVTSPSSGSWYLSDEADWEWLRDRIVEAS
jgi:hypothetical protein